MTRDDIERIFTDKVTELLNKGYNIYPYTMRGSQGELAHIDLSNGKELIRVLIDSRGNYGDTYSRIIRILVGRYTEEPSGCNHDTIWNERLETVSETEIAQISESYYTTIDASRRMQQIRLARWRSQKDTHDKLDLSMASKEIILRWLRKRPLMKTCQLKDIEAVRRVTVYPNRHVYEIEARGKKFILK